jgi:hypothetical protein
MSVTATTATDTTPLNTTTRSTSSLPRTTLVAGVVAAAATTGAAAALHAAGVSFEVKGQMIPLAAFAEMTLLGAVVGGLILAALNRLTHSARRTFLGTAAALTTLSCIPSVAWPHDTGTKLALVALHLLAAAVVVPALARRARH